MWILMRYFSTHSTPAVIAVSKDVDSLKGLCNPSAEWKDSIEGTLTYSPEYLGWEHTITKVEVV